MAAGHILGLPIAVLGVTVLAWGNSVSDLLANRAIARGNAPGAAKMAISGECDRLPTMFVAELLSSLMPTPRCVAGCYGEPIFNRLFGVALSYFIITLPAFPELALFSSSSWRSA